MSEPDAKSRTRSVACIHVDDDVVILIDHVYMAGLLPCHDCEAPSHDPGMVGMAIREGDGEDSVVTSALMLPEVALLVADRLTRAAHLVLESMEEGPDMEREMEMLAAAQGDAT